MKKMRISIVAITVMIFMLFTMALAEAFTIHSGVQFGMSKYEVIKQENANGFSTNMLDSGNINLKGIIAGIDGSAILYRFNNTGSMYSSTYTFAGSMLNYTAHDTDYNTIESSLENKYGKSQYSTINGLEAAVPPKYNDEYTTCLAESRGFNEEYSFINMKENVLRYDQWILPQNNGTYILIDHFIMQTESKTNTTLSHHLQYICFDAVTFEAYSDTHQNMISNDI